MAFMMQRNRTRNPSRHRVLIFATRLARSAEPANIPPRRLRAMPVWAGDYAKSALVEALKR
jgi:hypothetical protein